MNRIEVEVASKGLYALRYFLALIVGLTTAFMIAPPQENSKFVFLLAMLPGYLIFEQLTKKLDIGNVIMQMDKEGLQFIWAKQIMFHNKADLSIQWSEIIEHSYNSSTHLDEFVLKLKSRSKVKFYFKFIDEDFINFYYNMQELTTVISKVDDSVHISKTVDFFETEFGKWLIFGFGVVILIACGFILHIRNWQELNWFGFAVLLCFGLEMIIPRIRHLANKVAAKRNYHP